LESNEPVVIRLAEERDLPALGRLGGVLVRTHHAFDARRFMAPHPGLDEGYGWFLGAELKNPDAAVFVAERQGPQVAWAQGSRAAQDSQAAQDSIVGYAYAGLEGQSWKELREPAGFLHDVVVDVTCRGSRIGSRLAEAAFQWLAERGAPRVLVWTANANQSAQRLFQRLGFRTTMIEMTREVDPDR
jgi:ribosomal protein S18 acetylase RimI-like enzyme